MEEGGTEPKLPKSSQESEKHDQKQTTDGKPCKSLAIFYKFGPSSSSLPKTGAWPRMRKLGPKFACQF